MQRTILSIIIVLFGLMKLEAAPKRAASFVIEPIEIDSDSTYSKKTIRKKKITAIGLALAVGPFGMHRLYLGTDSKVPIVYSLTLGAFGILPVIDIVAILTTRDIKKFENNKRVVMWAE